MPWNHSVECVFWWKRQKIKMSQEMRVCGLVNSCREMLRDGGYKEGCRRMVELLGEVRVGRGQNQGVSEVFEVFSKTVTIKGGEEVAGYKVWEREERKCMVDI